MIFISVGTHYEQFDRLLKEMDKLIETKKIKDKVIAQTGYSTYKPKNYKHFEFANWQTILKLNKEANIIVTHGGAGNLLTASHFNKPTVAVPRMKKYGEHVNDHQLQLVKKLEREGRVVAVYDITKLENAIIKAKTLKAGNQKLRREKKIISIIRSCIEKIANEK